MTTSALPARAPSDSRPASLSALVEQYFSRLNSGGQVPWDLSTFVALFTLVVIWAACLHMTWATWGSLTVDSGHEMYVPSVLSEGKMLYRDVWFMYGPAAPYLNSFLFRLFGVHLNVLYWAGSLAALGSSVLLFVCGLRLSSRLAGWSAGAVVLLEAFHPTIFSFPLPYSFSPVYGCLSACLFLWLAIGAANSSKRGWIFWAGAVAAVALLLKFEFGAACYSTLALLIAMRGFERRSWRFLAGDVVAILPGVVLCALVVRWMVSIAGVDFITQENFLSWPSAYFMKTYGKMWLAQTGFSLSLSAFVQAAKQTFALLGFWQGLHLLMTWKRAAGRAIFLRAVLFLAALAYFVILIPGRDILRAIFFPEDMVLYVTLAAIAGLFYFWRQPERGRIPAVIFLLIFSSFLAFRILLKMTPWGYAIYYNGPVVLSFLLLLRPLIPRSVDSRRSVFLAELLIGLACVAVPALFTKSVLAETAGWVPLTTERGTIRVTKHLAENYKVALSFMKEKSSHGQAVLSVPEDTSLYFLSGTHSPTRVFQFTPGVLVPGKMTDETIREIERKPVRYLLWSNRLFPEYGVLRFGIDYDQAIGGYLTSHYRRVGPLVPDHPILGEWNAQVWERIPDGELPSSPANTVPKNAIFK